MVIVCRKLENLLLREISMWFTEREQMYKKSLSYFQRLKSPVLLVIVLLSLFAVFCTACAEPKFKKVYTLKHIGRPSSVTVLNDEQVLIKMGAAGEVYNYKENSSFPAVSFHMGEYGIIGGYPYGYTITPISKSKSIILGNPRCNKNHLEKCPKVTAAIYDVQKNTIKHLTTWFPTREGHTATLLKNGKILLIGGVGNRFDVKKGLITEKERFELNNIILLDPKTLDYKVVGQLSQNRFRHSTLQIDENRFLIAGGKTNSPDYPKVESWEINNHKMLDTIELFDLSTGKSEIIGHIIGLKTYSPKFFPLGNNIFLKSGRPIERFNLSNGKSRFLLEEETRDGGRLLRLNNNHFLIDTNIGFALFDVDSLTLTKPKLGSKKFEDRIFKAHFVTPDKEHYYVLENNPRTTNKRGAYIYKLKQ